MLYFLPHAADTFHGRIAPTLAASWRQRRFGPIVALAADLAPTLAACADRFHLTAEERPLLMQLRTDWPFDRRLWRHLAGEVLLYAAADGPAIQTAADTLAALVTPDQRTVIEQAHFGRRDLDFDGIPYRPGHAGFNDVDDVARLADDLSQVDVARWTAADLAGLPALADDDERDEELVFARECFASIRELYEQARARGQVVVCEDI